MKKMMANKKPGFGNTKIAVGGNFGFLAKLINKI